LKDAENPPAREKLEMDVGGSAPPAPPAGAASLLYTVVVPLHGGGRLVLPWHS